MNKLHFNIYTARYAKHENESGGRILSIFPVTETIHMFAFLQREHLQLAATKRKPKLIKAFLSVSFANVIEYKVASVQQK